MPDPVTTTTTTTTEKRQFVNFKEGGEWAVTGIIGTIALVALSAAIIYATVNHTIDLRLLGVIVMIIGLSFAWIGFHMHKWADEGQDKWGGPMGIVGSLFLIASGFIFRSALTPEAAAKWEEFASPYVQTELLRRPVIHFTPPPTVKGDIKAATEGTDRIWLTKPTENKDGTTIPPEKEFVIQIRVDPDVAKNEGVLVHKNRKALEAWYKTEHQSSFADER